MEKSATWRKGFTFMIRSLAVLAAGTVLAFCAASDLHAAATAVTAPVGTTNGPIRGYTDNGIHYFLGIPYGAPPVGDLRFQPPQKPKPWTRVQDTMQYGPSAMQLASGGATVTYPGVIGPALDQMFGAGREDVLRQSEDCLYLNVWTAGLDSKKRPVMFWIHGGGHNYGSGSWPVYNGHNLAKNHDVVVVTVNHRLNIFGYLNLAALDEKKYADSGNAGHLDLILALQWVHDNIERFGGDPGNVTIFGQSGGGRKVSFLMGMPQAKGLFHRAIIQSGAALKAMTREDSGKKAKMLLDKLGVRTDNAKDITEIPADKLLGAVKKIQPPGPSTRFWEPVAGGSVLPSHPFDPEATPLCADVPLMIGFTKDEVVFHTLGASWMGNITWDNLPERSKRYFGNKTEPLIAAFRKLHPNNSPSYILTDLHTLLYQGVNSYRLAQRKAAGAAPVYLYIFSWEPSGEMAPLKAAHTMELPFIFDNVDLCPILLGSAKSTKNLGKQMSKTWATFARTGNPNAKGLPDWPRFDADKRATMIFDVRSQSQNDPLGPVLKIMAGE